MEEHSTNKKGTFGTLPPIDSSLKLIDPEEDLPVAMLPVEREFFCNDLLEYNPKYWAPASVVGTTVDQSNRDVAMMEMESFLSEAALGEATALRNCKTHCPTALIQIPATKRFMSTDNNSDRLLINWTNGMPLAHPMTTQEYNMLPRRLTFGSAEDVSLNFLYPVNLGGNNKLDDLIPMIAEIENEEQESHFGQQHQQQQPNQLAHLFENSPYRTPTTPAAAASWGATQRGSGSSDHLSQRVIPTSAKPRTGRKRTSSATTKVKTGRRRIVVAAKNSIPTEMILSMSVASATTNVKHSRRTNQAIRGSTKTTPRIPASSKLPHRRQKKKATPNCSIWVRRSSRRMLKDRTNKDNK